MASGPSKPPGEKPKQSPRVGTYAWPYPPRQQGVHLARYTSKTGASKVSRNASGSSSAPTPSPFAPTPAPAPAPAATVVRRALQPIAASPIASPQPTPRPTPTLEQQRAEGSSSRAPSAGSSPQISMMDAANDLPGVAPAIAIVPPQGAPVIPPIPIANNLDSARSTLYYEIHSSRHSDAGSNPNTPLLDKSNWSRQQTGSSTASGAPSSKPKATEREQEDAARLEAEKAVAERLEAEKANLTTPLLVKDGEAGAQAAPQKRCGVVFRVAAASTLLVLVAAAVATVGVWHARVVGAEPEVAFGVPEVSGWAQVSVDDARAFSADSRVTGAFTHGLSELAGVKPHNVHVQLSPMEQRGRRLAARGAAEDKVGHARVDFQLRFDSDKASWSRAERVAHKLQHSSMYNATGDMRAAFYYAGLKAYKMTVTHLVASPCAELGGRRYMDNWGNDFRVDQKLCNIRFLYEGTVKSGYLTGSVLNVPGWAKGAVEDDGSVKFQDGGLWKVEEPAQAPAPHPGSHSSPDPAPQHAEGPEATPHPTSRPTPEPTPHPTPEPTPHPTAHPTPEPTLRPTAHPTAEPTRHPTEHPTPEPTPHPTAHPTPQHPDSHQASHEPTTTKGGGWWSWGSSGSTAHTTPPPEPRQHDQDGGGHHTTVHPKQPSTRRPTSTHPRDSAHHRPGEQPTPAWRAPPWTTTLATSYCKDRKQHPRCDGGLCKQETCVRPTCDGGGCHQRGTLEPSCEGGGCDQSDAVRPMCSGGQCRQGGASSPTCSGGSCSRRLQGKAPDA